MTSVSYPVPRRAPILAQAVAAMVAGLLLFLGATATWVVAYQLIYAGKVFPGVSVAGVDLSGLSCHVLLPTGPAIHG